MRAARLTRGAEVMAVQVVVTVVDNSSPAVDGDVRDAADAAAEAGECLMTSADDAGIIRRCRRADCGLLDVFPSKTPPSIHSCTTDITTTNYN